MKSNFSIGLIDNVRLVLQMHMTI